MADVVDRADDWLEWADHLCAVHTTSKDWSPLLSILCRLIPADGVRLLVDEGQVRLTNVTVGNIDDGLRQSRVRRVGRRQIELAVVRGTGNLGPEELRRLDRLFDQLAQAFAHRVEHQAGLQFADDLAFSLRRLPIGALIISPDLAVHFRTPEADRLLEAKDGLLVGTALGASDDYEKPLTLEVLDGRAASELRSALQLMLRNTDQREQMISVARSAGRPFGLLVARLGDPRPDSHFLVLVSDPDVPAQLAPEALRILYRLTPAESRLCAALADGNTLKTYAQAEGVSLETVRSQLKQAMIKTSTHKQAQLVRLLVTGPAAYSS